MSLKSDVAGATIMAFGTSIPELITSVIGAIHWETPENRGGMGSIVGSAVFNLLFVIAASSLAVKERIR